MKGTIQTFRLKPRKQGVLGQIAVKPFEDYSLTRYPHLIHPHRTAFYHILLFEQCSPVHLVDFTPIQVQPYSLLFISQEKVHCFDNLEKYRGMAVLFTEDFFCRKSYDYDYLHHQSVFCDSYQTPCVKLSQSCFKDFRNIAQILQKECLQPPDHLQHEILKNTLHTFLLLAERYHQQETSNMVSGSVQEYRIRFRELLDADFRVTRRVSDYAKKLMISEKKLAHVVTTVYGKPPKEMIDERVILEAKRLLCYERYSVKEISYELGFMEPTNFIKFFRKKTGYSPLSFHKQFRLAQ